MSRYLDNTDCMMTIEATRNRIFGLGERIAPMNIDTRIHRNPRVKKPIITIEDHIKDDPNVLIAIFNDQKFINIILNCRKQKTPLAYIFVERDYLTCVIKNNESYPLMVLRLPVNSPNVYASQLCDKCYTFPVRELSGNRECKYTKNSTYVLKYRAEGGNIEFVYELYNKLDTPHVFRTISDAQDRSIINTIFNSTCMAYFTRKIQDTENYLLMFLNMKIMILERVTDIQGLLQFVAKSSGNAENYFELSADILKYINKSSPQSPSRNEHPVCSQQSSIIWDVGSTINAKTIRYDIDTYDSLFKINYNKLVTPNDKMYYMFTSYRDDFLFIKLITSFELTADHYNPDTFINIFNKEYQILECYACKKVE